MVKNGLLISGITILTLAAMLGVLRWFAPHLLGIPVDLRMVGVSDEVVPFFDRVFRKDDYDDISSDAMLIPDPYLLKAKPLYPDQQTTGPHDILGFRNRSISNVAKIITIGDSQTYGNNVSLESSWPKQLANFVELDKSEVYNMSVGGWGAVEYLEIFTKALLFNPKVIVVAFYTGNDPIDSFKKAYSSERWSYLRADENLSSSDAPPNPEFPPPNDELWEVNFSSSVQLLFAPKYRLTSNDQTEPAVDAGYEIMALVAQTMAQMVNDQDVTLLFTIIPTTELVYEKRVTNEGLQAPPSLSRTGRFRKRSHACAGR